MQPSFLVRQSMSLTQTAWRNHKCLPGWRELRIQQSRPFSLSTRLARAQHGSHRPPPSNPHPFPSLNQDPSIPRSSIKEIFVGAPRSVKIVVITAFCILATIETTFWINVGRRYFSSSPESQDAPESLGSVIDEELRRHKLVGQAYERYTKSQGKGED